MLWWVLFDWFGFAWFWFVSLLLVNCDLGLGLFVDVLLLLRRLCAIFRVYEFGLLGGWY